MHSCNWPNCAEEGLFKAPKNPRDLREKQYFCTAHIKEFNKRWNGLDGFSEDEIYGLQEPTAVWQRPSWSAETPAKEAPPPKATQARMKGKTTFFNSADDLFGFFNSRMARELNGERAPTRKALPADVKAACTLFSIENPLEDMLLKRRYLNLVKQNHPDVNKSPTAAEAIKRINVAYKILCDYRERQGISG